MVAAGAADLFQIVVLSARADAFLAGSGARARGLFVAEENVLELVHAGVGEEKRGVVRGDERRRGHDAMSAGLKKL